MIADPRQLEFDRDRVKWMLIDREPVKTYDLMEWALWMNDPEASIVAQTRVFHLRVSTVFLGLDHNWSSEGPPILFETMTFGWPLNNSQYRYATYEEAEDGHARALRMARWSLTPPGLIVLGFRRLIEAVNWWLLRRRLRKVVKP